MGDFGVQGTVNCYLMSHSPCVVGNLWDVTDRDLDLLSKKLFELWNLTEKSGRVSHTISVALLHARMACKLRYLNGAATVVYGLPMALALDS